MKKYFIAAMVALAVFAMSAFAAELTVNGGVLQAGSDSNLKCTDQVEVDFTGFEGDVYRDGTLATGGGFTTAQLSGLGAETCNGASVYMRIFDNEGNEIWRSVPIPTAAGNTLDYGFSDGQTQGGYELYGATPTQPGSVILSSDIARVDVQIDG